MRAWLVFLFAAQTLQFQITDGRGKETSAVTIEAGAADEDGWRPLRVGKAKGDPVLVWPFDGSAKLPDGPEPIPAIVIQRGEEKALANRKAVAAIATPVVLEDGDSESPGCCQNRFHVGGSGLRLPRTW